MLQLCQGLHSPRREHLPFNPGGSGWSAWPGLGTPGFAVLQPKLDKPRLVPQLPQQDSSTGNILSLCRGHLQHPTSEQAGDHWDENAASQVSVSDDSNGGAWTSYSPGSLFLGKALPGLRELIFLPSLLEESCPPVPRGKGGAYQVQRCCNTFLGALPLSVRLYLSVMLPRYTREWMESSLGTKGL